MFDKTGKATRTVLLGRDYFEKHERIFNTIEFFAFDLRVVSTEDELFQHVRDVIGRGRRGRRGCIIVISDQLTTERLEGGRAPSKLATEIRGLFFENPRNLCGMVALVDGDSHRTTDIDVMVDYASLRRAELKRAILRAAHAIWLKSPFRTPDRLGTSDAITVELVQSREELRECFALRRRVYDAMGYLPEDVSSVPSQIEIDAFDTRSLHWVAKDWSRGKPHESVVGTVRLVTRTPRHKSHNLLASRPVLEKEQQRWTRELATETAFRRKVKEPITMPFPIFRNSEFGDKWPEFLEANQHRHGGEISRLVVSPKYRGYGIGRLSMRAVIAMGKKLDKHFLLLECIPSHAVMYEKFGFLPLEGHHSRDQELDQLLRQSVLVNSAVAMANSDLELLAASELLCLCRTSDCWKRHGFRWKA